MNKKLFYTITLNDNLVNVDIFKYIAMLKGSNNSLFLNNSDFISANMSSKNTKLLFVLNKPELYYKNNYKYFDEFIKLFDTNIKQYNAIGDGYNFTSYTNEWTKNLIKSYMKNLS
jgi:hypothetical protein